jgi:hypothetical protein
MAMRQTRVSPLVERTELDAHLALLFGDVDGSSDRRSYQERYDALHHVDATPLRSPAAAGARSLLDDVFPLIKLTTIACIVGTAMLYVWVNVFPAQVARLRAAELQHRRNRRPLPTPAVSVVM